MIVYHGGYCEIQTPVLKPALNQKDFGQGFYCTEILAQAERWSKCFSAPTRNIYGYIHHPALNILEFPQMSEEWLDFIAACRCGETHHHDIVIGAIANDQVWNYIADFINGVLTREQFWVLAKFKHPTHQMAFCTQRSLQSLTFKESIKVSL